MRSMLVSARLLGHQTKARLSASVYISRWSYIEMTTLLTFPALTSSGRYFPYEAPPVSPLPDQVPVHPASRQLGTPRCSPDFTVSIWCITWQHPRLILK